jgi:hypothetical protein
MAECESLKRLARPSGFVGAAAEQQDDKTMRQRDGGCPNKATELRDDSSENRLTAQEQSTQASGWKNRWWTSFVCVLYIPRPEGHWGPHSAGHSSPSRCHCLCQTSARRPAPLFALGETPAQGK